MRHEVGFERSKARAKSPFISSKFSTFFLLLFNIKNSDHKTTDKRIADGNNVSTKRSNNDSGIVGDFIDTADETFQDNNKDLDEVEDQVDEDALYDDLEDFATSLDGTSRLDREAVRVLVFPE